MNEVLRKLNTEFLLDDVGDHGHFSSFAIIGVASAPARGKGSMRFGLEGVASAQRAL
jgi:hypothetical protein